MSLHLRPEVGQKLAEWATGNEVPDPQPMLVVKGYRVLVRPLGVKDKTKGGIILPDQTKEDANYLNTIGRVVAIGPLAWKRPDYEIEGPWCAIGDYVLFPKFGGGRIIYGGVKYVLINDDEVQAVVPDIGKVGS